MDSVEERVDSVEERLESGQARRGNTYSVEESGMRRLESVLL